MEVFLLFVALFIAACIIAFFIGRLKNTISQSMPKNIAADDNQVIPAEVSGSASFQLFTVERTMRQLTDLLASQGLVKEEEAADYIGQLVRCVFKGPLVDNKLTIEQVMSALDAELIPVYEYAKQLRQQGAPHAESMALSLKEWHKNHNAIEEALY